MARTGEGNEILTIKHVYLDLDHGGPEALSSVENSGSVPKPNFILGSHRVEDRSLSAHAGLFSAMLPSVLVSRETIVLSQLLLRRPSSRLFPSRKALATETQQPVEWSVVARRSLP